MLWPRPSLLGQLVVTRWCSGYVSSRYVSARSSCLSLMLSAKMMEGMGIGIGCAAISALAGIVEQSAKAVGCLLARVGIGGC